jgi:hypothetical protein
MGKESVQSLDEAIRTAGVPPAVLNALFCRIDGCRELGVRDTFEVPTIVYDTACL